MKQLKYILVVFVATILTVACSEKNQSENDTDALELKAISAQVGDVADIGITKAPTIPSTDPSTTHLADRGALGWKLDVQLYDGAVPYIYGQNTFLWSSGGSWVPQTGQTTYFPDYSTQLGKFTLYPDNPTGPVILDQSTDISLLKSDILYRSTNVIPAHILGVQLVHLQSMIDFTFERMPLSVSSVKVEVGSPAVTYTPYVVPGTFRYLLILPSLTTVTDPTIVVTTSGGTTYRQLVNIIGNTTIGNPTALQVNHRYIFQLRGLELGLSPITIVDWVTGGSIQGNYIAETAYPTFRGPASTSCTVTYDNGLTQVLTFNSQGEYTVKPNGRTIVLVTTLTGSCSASVILNGMIIDLTTLIDECNII